MRTTLIAIAIVCALGCQQKSAQAPAAQQQPAVAASTPLTPEQLGEIGAQIHRHPDDARKILAGRGITPEQFEKAIREVAQNPDAARRYRDAYRKAG